VHPVGGQVDFVAELKLARSTRSGTPSRTPLRKVICIIALGANAASKPMADSQCQALGPATVTLPQRDVTDVTTTRRFVYSHCSHSSNAAVVRSTPALVVLTQ